MNQYKFSTFGHTDALGYAKSFLQQYGWQQLADPDRADFLLLPVPSFDSNGNIIGTTAITEFPNNTTIIGGNLISGQLFGHKTIDLLQDPIYLAENAAITAHCAVSLATAQLPVTMQNCSVLVIGWGRIGKCLAALLKNMGATVTVAARNPIDRAMLLALGYHTVSVERLDTSPYRLIYNTAPAMLLPTCPGQSLKIDLASKPGLGGCNLIHARGLPNKYAPESSGKLIADSIVRIITGKEYTQ